MASTKVSVHTFFQIGPTGTYIGTPQSSDHIFKGKLFYAIEWHGPEKEINFHRNIFSDVQEVKEKNFFFFKVCIEESGNNKK